MQTAGQLALQVPSTVESVVKSATNGRLIAAAAQLWIRPDDLVLDVTYGNGLFWSEYQPQHLVCHDLSTDQVDFRRLPEGDCTADVAVFDPPYILQGGRDSSTTQDFLQRYGLFSMPKNRQELHRLIAAGIIECARVLTPSGRLFVKCMDYVDSGRYQKGRHLVVQIAETAAGLEQVDELIHHSGVGPHPYDSFMRSRRAHSFLCIFQKPPIWRKAKPNGAHQS